METKVYICKRCGTPTTCNSVACSLCSCNDYLETDLHPSFVRLQRKTGQWNKVLKNYFYEEQVLKMTEFAHQLSVEKQPQTATVFDTPPHNQNASQKTNNLVTGIVAILLIIGVIFLISQCTKDDGTCERCNKEGVYEIGGDKYCEKHYLDVLAELIAWDGD